MSSRVSPLFFNTNKHENAPKTSPSRLFEGNWIYFHDYKPFITSTRGSLALTKGEKKLVHVTTPDWLLRRLFGSFFDTLSRDNNNEGKIVVKNSSLEKCRKWTFSEKRGKSRWKSHKTDKNEIVHLFITFYEPGSLMGLRFPLRMRTRRKFPFLYSSSLSWKSSRRRREVMILISRARRRKWFNNGTRARAHLPLYCFGEIIAKRRLSANWQLMEMEIWANFWQTQRTRTRKIKFSGLFQLKKLNQLGCRILKSEGEGECCHHHIEIPRLDGFNLRDRKSVV